MILNFEGGVVWSSFDHGNLLPCLTWNSEEEIEASNGEYGKYAKNP
jgi:hypothetical protein